MCGLTGVASTERRHNDMERKRAFPEALEAASWRGRDSTGLALVTHEGLKRQADVYKRALSASDFIQLNRFTRFMNSIDDYVYIIGHARAATRSVVNDWNAHPFQFENITLCHNGTIYNTHELNVEVTGNTVDSAFVTASMAKHGVKETLEKLRGGYALVWHDAKDGSINFARNEAKPLVWCYIEKENTMYWHSELETLYAVLNRNKIKLDGKFKVAGVHVWYKFPNVKDFREIVKTPFTPRPEPWLGQQNRRHGNHHEPAAWDARVTRIPGATTSPGTPPSSNPSGQPGTNDSQTGGDSETTSPLDNELENMGYPAFGKRETASPKSRRKERVVKEKLLKLGLKLANPQCIVPTGFSAYNNQRGQRGLVSGVSATREGVLFEVPNMFLDEWKRAKDAKKLYGRIANIRYKNKKTPVIVLDYAPDLMERFVWPKEVQTRRASSFRQRNDSDLELYDGPGGSRITEEDFLARTQHGCCNCSDFIPVEDAPVTLWVADDRPLCKTCAMDDSIIGAMGLTIEKGF